VLVGSLADRLGIGALADRLVGLGAVAGAANAGQKILSLIFAMVLGAEFAYKMNAGQAPPRARHLTVREVQAKWFDHLGELEAADELRPRTVASYKNGVRLHFTPIFGSRQIGFITADDLVAWHEAQRRTGAAAWSIRARWMGIRGLFGYAARTGLIATNFCDLLVRRERPKPGKAKERYLTAEEMGALLQHVSGEGSAVVPLLLFSGLRASEALGLAWGDIDFAHQLIRVGHQMSRKGQRTKVKSHAGRREVILMDELAQRLRKRRIASRFSQDSLRGPRRSPPRFICLPPACPFGSYGTQSNNANHAVFQRFSEWSQPGSNRRPPACKADQLVHSWLVVSRKALQI